MKTKLTQKEVKRIYKTIVSVNYCGLWYLLRYKEPVAYIGGKFGWDADIYEVRNNVAICTGYRTSRCSNISADFDLIEEYNEKARKIYKTFCGSSEELDEILDELLEEFLEKVLKKDNYQNKKEVKYYVFINTIIDAVIHCISGG